MQRSGSSFDGFINKFNTHLYLILFIPLVFIIIPLIPPGVVMFGDFPLLETSLYPGKFLSTWIDYGSHFGFETLPRYPFIAFGYILNSINIGADLISKFLVILGFASASFSFYFSFIHFMKNKAINHVPFYRIAAVIGSIFYAYNAWSFHRIHHWYLWFGYAVLPLFLMLLHFSLKYPLKWKYIIPTVLIWSLVSGYPHMVIFYGLFYLGFSLFFILRNIRNRNGNRESIFNMVKPIIIIFVLYVVINLYWIYPYSMYILYSGEALAPSIYVTEEYTKELSNDSSFLNVFRLIEDTWIPKIVNVTPPPDSFFYPIWLFASFLLPIVAFSAVIFTRNIKYVIPIFALALIGILLTLGTNAPYNFYTFLLFEAPLSPILRFIFREPDKWAFLIALSYSFLLSIAIFEYLRRVNRFKHSQIILACIITLLITSFILYSYPIYQETAQKVLSPVILPDEYKKLNAYLQNSDQVKVFYVGQDFNPKIWNKERFFCCLDEVSSVKPNIDTYYPTSENYHNYLKESLDDGKNRNISNLAFPLGTRYLIYSNDEAQGNNSKFLKGLSSLGDIQSTKNIGFFNLYEAEGIFKKGEFNIPKNYMLVTGGPDMFTSLNSVPQFHSRDTSLSFLDQTLERTQKLKLMQFGDVLAIGNDGNDFAFSMLDKKYVISPYDYTNHGGLVNDWSKDSSLSTGYGMFHTNSELLNMESWNFDYGRGLVITQNVGSNLSMPFNIEDKDENTDKDNNIHLFIRLLKNQKGGILNVLIDGTRVTQIDTLDRTANYFQWEQIGHMNLTKGNHKLTLENIAGFNAINLLAIVPDSQIATLFSEPSKLLKPESRILQLLEAESSFQNSKGKDTGASHKLFSDKVEDNATGVFSTNHTGQFTVPAGSDLVSLEFLGNKTNSKSALSMRNLQIWPIGPKYNSFTSDFEGKMNSHTSDLLSGEIAWLNNNQDILSISGANNSLSGKNNLTVDIKQANFTQWGVISTDYIPVKGNIYYNYTLGISANNVDQLHSKVYYFDSNKTELGSNFVFGGRDGTFKESFTNSLLPAKGAKFIKLQIWVKPNANANSAYTLRDVKVEGETGYFSWMNKDSDILSISGTNTSSSGNSLKVDIKQVNFTHWGVISTDYIPVNGHAFYNLSLDFQAENVSQLHSKIYFFDSSRNSALSKEYEYVLDGEDGSFNQKIKKYVSPPVGTKYVMIQVWVKPNSNTKSAYILDNVKLEEIIPSRVTFNGSFNFSDNINPVNLKTSNTAITSIFLDDNSRDAIVSNNYTDNQNGKPDPNHIYLQTEPIPVEENHTYNYAMAINGENISSLSTAALYKNSEDVVVSTKFGNNASNGRVLSLSPGAEISSRLDIVKSSNYMINLRAKSCKNCTYVKLSIPNKEEISDNHNKTDLIYSLKGKGNNLNWISANSSIFLTKGIHEIRVYADSQTDLDSIIVYSIPEENSSSKDNGKNNYLLNSKPEPLDGGINSTAIISDYKKISSTKYTINITNASKPYILSFAESFDPLWIANAVSDSTSNPDDKNNNFRTGSMALYSVINGFLINKTGSYILTIEYQPQKWLNDASVMSLVALIAMIIIYFMYKNWIHLKKLVVKTKRSVK